MYESTFVPSKVLPEVHTIYYVRVRKYFRKYFRTFVLAEIDTLPSEYGLDRPYTGPTKVLPSKVDFSVLRRYLQRTSVQRCTSESTRSSGSTSGNIIYFRT
jgi:hypothetical protein